MPFPPSSREIYKTNPLEEVICQLRYPAVLSISATSPAQFQDAIRSTYPWYEETNSSVAFSPFPVPKEVSDFLESASLPPMRQYPEHRFSIEDRARSVTLTQDFIAVAETRYDCWEVFRKQVEVAEQVLWETYEPAFYNRVGLRYCDVLARDQIGLPDTPWSELFNPSFLGMLGDNNLTGDVRESKVESLVAIPDVAQGQVLIRHGLARTQPGGEQVYLIDADFHTNRRSRRNDVFEILDKFNKWGGYFFRWAASEKLRDALGPTHV